ncbi:MAG: hypothetical protein L0216_00065 [Planctomycetales bacterium]|nr:hypothetical protein [Planctomycetales bacterium]
MNDGTFSPQVLYVYLKARFGAPNGPFMAVRGPGSDNLLQWDYVVAAGDDVLHVVGTNSWIQFHALTKAPLAADGASKVMEAIRSDLQRTGSAMKGARATLEAWTLVLNPYHRVQRTVADIATELRSLDLSEPTPLPHVTTSAVHAAYMKEMRRWTDAQRRATVLATSIRMLCPVLAEAFVNLVIFLLVRPDVRADERLYQDVVRRQIDVRVRELHITCQGLKQPVDPAAPQFKAFHTVMNSRNDWLHGNVDPKRLEVERILFDGTIPLFPDERPFLHRVVRSIARHAEPEQALAELRDIEAFVDYVKACMTDRLAPEVDLLARTEHFGYRTDTGKIGILFDDAAADFYVFTDAPPGKAAASAAGGEAPPPPPPPASPGGPGQAESGEPSEGGGLA